MATVPKQAAAKTPAAKKPAAPRRKAAATRRTEITHDAIAQRAYELHLTGCSDPLLNWLEAERELAGTA